jgi:hypothetical protein
MIEDLTNIPVNDDVADDIGLVLHSLDDVCTSCICFISFNDGSYSFFLVSLAVVRAGDFESFRTRV